jgi:hypothetical protein
MAEGSDGRYEAPRIEERVDIAPALIGQITSLVIIRT